MIVIAIAAVLTAALALALRLGRAASALLALVVAALYLPFGQPDMPAAFAPRDAAAQERQTMLLAARPMQTLEKNPHDMQALAMMGEISRRLGRAAAAHDFYTRAAAVADKAGDADRAAVYRDRAEQEKAIRHRN